jgi:hypothetical protein
MAQVKIGSSQLNVGNLLEFSGLADELEVRDVTVVRDVFIDLAGLEVGEYYRILELNTTDFALVGATLVLATALNAGDEYIIVNQGTSDFTLVGAQNNSSGTTFVATGPTPGNGEVYYAVFQATDVGTGTGVASKLNVALGYRAGENLGGSAALSNTFIGAHAGTQSSNTQNCVAIGDRAGEFMNGVTGNTLMGSHAGGRITSGNRNTIIGYDAGDELTNGFNNTMIGVATGCGGGGLENNIFIGHQAGRNEASNDPNLQGRLIINNEVSRAPATQRPFIIGNMTTGLSAELRINAGLVVSGSALADDEVFRVRPTGAIELAADPGTAGQVLTSQGGSSQATWTTPTTNLSALTFVVAANAGSHTIGNTSQGVVLEPAAPIATFTVTMPAAPTDGQVAYITTTEVITTLTINANAGQSIAGSAASANGAFTYTYRSSNTTWYRIA